MVTANLYKILDEYRLEEFEECGRIKANKHPSGDLLIWNYTNKAQFANEWSLEERVCRGVITNLNGDIIARGMPKFFNYGDPRTGIEDYSKEFIFSFEKFDGSLGVIYPVDGSWAVATRGSFTSDQAKEATRMLHTHEYRELLTMAQQCNDAGYTVLVEIIYPENRIVVDYHGQSDLKWIGTVKNSTGEFGPNYNICTGYGDGWIPDVDTNKEGHVCQTESGVLFKVKGEDYVRLHKTLFGLSNKTVWETLVAPNGYQAFVDLRNQLPADTAVWADRKYKQLQAHQNRLYRQTLDIYTHLTDDYPDRATLARRLQREAPEFLSFVFTLLDKGDVQLIKSINKAIKPKKFEPYMVEKED
ncbi:RNA ligase and tail fiber protein attachment catalyst [Arthrobacter phage Amigo]|uniref:RNA ligase n=5 Tax=Amigovirus amigo TaxID=1982100 RepID=A0A5J6TF34_9CAUD|nr:RNA ligase and tail fiber protein attachment catalyst [Arthrobacter phage Amigo]QFG08357.1 RNA ligase [Arthrobacter phage Yeezus]QFG13406.1 RNA ligase [Arthrobacter phage Ichor]QFG13924.1 RNA ligase [Arthrobacter phage Jaek]QJD51711.1 RNA ligase [Arthrobacter phage Boersma]ALY08414.1 RNA ligase [Arthrobacter phage Amigo]